MRLLWTPRALRQLDRAVEYIAEDNPPAALGLYDRIVEKANQLVAFPDIGPPGKRPGTRDLTITGTDYVLVYRVVGDVIQILAVWHGKQSRRPL